MNIYLQFQQDGNEDNGDGDVDDEDDNDDDECDVGDDEAPSELPFMQHILKHEYS